MAKKEDVIEKAVQRKVGDMHPNGKWAWTEYKPGKFDWRPVKKGTAAGGSSSSSGSGSASSTSIGRGDTVEHNGEKKKVVSINNDMALLDDGSNVHLIKLKKVTTPSKPSAQQIADAKAKGSGKPMNSQQLVQWAQKTSDDNLLKVANSKNGNAQMRKIAYDALEVRGFDMSKVDTSGTLAQLMKMTGKGSAKPAAGSGDDEEDDVAPTNQQASVDIDDDADEGGTDGNQITEKWYLDKNDDRVKKMLNLKTK